MNRRIHGAPARALSNALAALSKLAFWIGWTADAGLPPEPSVSACALLDEAADRAEPPSGSVVS